MKEILSSYSINKDMIVLIPIQVSDKSYEISESDFASVKKYSGAIVLPQIFARQRSPRSMVIQ